MAKSERAKVKPKAHGKVPLFLCLLQCIQRDAGDPGGAQSTLENAEPIPLEKR